MPFFIYLTLCLLPLYLRDLQADVLSASAILSLLAFPKRTYLGFYPLDNRISLLPFWFSCPETVPSRFASFIIYLESPDRFKLPSSILQVWASSAKLKGQKEKGHLQPSSLIWYRFSNPKTVSLKIFRLTK